MMRTLDIEKLENAVHLPDGRIRARCPACAADGRDIKGDHLMIFPDGRFGCAIYPGDRQHRRKISRIAGEPRGKGRLSSLRKIQITIVPKPP